MASEKIFRRVRRDKRALQYQPFEAGFIIADQEKDAAVLFIRRNGRPTVEVARPMLAALSVYGDRYETGPMTDREAADALAEHANALAMLREDLASLTGIAGQKDETKEEKKQDQPDRKEEKAEQRPEEPVKTPPVPQVMAAGTTETPPAAESIVGSSLIDAVDKALEKTVPAGS